MSNVYEFQARTIDGKEISLSEFSGQVLMIVNTASRCGFTPQYAEIEELHRRLRPFGFSALGFPCNQFMRQEPGDSANIRSFCENEYDVTFPLFEKIDVNGRHAHPLYAYLKRACPGVFGSGSIKWNFTKFLVDRRGKAVARFAPIVRPSDIEASIRRYL